MSDRDEDNLPVSLPLDRFVSGLRQQLRASISSLQEELKEAEEKNQPTLPVFLLDEVEVTVDARVNQKMAAKLDAGGEVAAETPNLLSVLVGKASGKAKGGVEATNERGESESTRVRILLRPKMASWDKDGWNITSDIFLQKPKGD